MASSEALNVKEAKAVPIDLGNVGPIGTCVVADIDGEAAVAAEAATAGEAAAVADGNIGTLGLTGVMMVGGPLGAIALFAGVRPICQ